MGCTKRTARSSPDKAAHDTLLPIIDQGVLRRIERLSPSPQASHEVSRLSLQATSTSMALSAGNSALHQQTM
ncbi:hypothetical protein LIER_21924 [Lithospermum erythrorhizon]|uniref:Uncharacterized protein n=1 Tax=Lithospermum erythrorhizon TaxID=34254 RepID=A0AAV3QV52_LITER